MAMRYVRKEPEWGPVSTEMPVSNFHDVFAYHSSREGSTILYL